MIHHERLLTRLSPHGFQLAWEQGAGQQPNFDYVRPSPVEGVFEHIDVDSKGKRGEAVYCLVWVSPVRGHRLRFKPSPEVDEYIEELGDVAAGLSYTVVKTRVDAITWESRVEQIAPERARGLALKHAGEVAAQTCDARRAAREYTRRLRKITDEPVMDYLAYQLSGRATPAQRQHAGRLDPGGVSGEVNYACQAAALGVAMFGAEVDPEYDGFATEPARKSVELKLRLNIAADLLRLGGS